MKFLYIPSAESIPEPILLEAVNFSEMIYSEVGLAYCNKLFFIKRELKNLLADERKVKRLKQETPVWDSFWNWLESITPAGDSKL
jgi:hypothetical protein